MKKYRLAILNTHPIQYYTPLYRRLAQEPEIDFTAYFCSKKGVESYIDPGFGKEIKWDIPLLEGYKYKFLNNLRKQEKSSGFFSLINPGIISELKNGHYDALLVNGQTPATTIIAILAAKLFGTKVFMRCETHLGLRRGKVKLILRPLVMRIFYKLFDAFLAIGTLNREFYLAHGVPPQKIFLTPYAVDNNFFISEVAQQRQQLSTCKKELGLPASAPVILFLAKLQTGKRPMDLLLAYQKLRRQGLEAHLAYVGSGEEEPALKQTVAAQNIPDVHFFGFRNQSELPKFFAASAVFAMPSASETWGLVVNEAMCASLPIVTTDVIGAARDLVVNGKNGFTYPVGDVNELAEVLMEVLREPIKRQQMAYISSQIISKWGHEECVIGIRQALASIKNA